MKFQEALAFRERLNSFIRKAGRDFFDLHHRNELYRNNRAPRYGGTKISPNGYITINWCSRGYWGDVEKTGQVIPDADEFMEFCESLWEIEEFGHQMEEE